MHLMMSWCRIWASPAPLNCNILKHFSIQYPRSMYLVLVWRFPALPLDLGEKVHGALHCGQDVEGRRQRGSRLKIAHPQLCSSEFPLTEKFKYCWKCVYRGEGDEWGLRIHLINENLSSKFCKTRKQAVEHLRLNVWRGRKDFHLEFFFRISVVVVSKMWCTSGKQIAKIKQGISPNYKFAVILMS